MMYRKLGFAELAAAVLEVLRENSGFLYMMPCRTMRKVRFCLPK